MESYDIKLKFVSLSSGSSGNCFYLGTASSGILIDVGIGVRTIRKYLRERGIALETITGILITHDHADHVKHAGSLSKHFHIPVYTTRNIHLGMDHCFTMTQKIPVENRRFLEKEQPYALGEFLVTPFEIPHDATENVGYFITCGSCNFCIITDMGHINPPQSVAHKYIQQSQYLVIESNYDEQMLFTGNYPQVLKERISSNRGHMSNRETAEYLATYYPPLLKKVWLCHLSKENNRPYLAYQEVEQALRKIGKNVGTDLTVSPLERTTASQIYELW